MKIGILTFHCAHNYGAVLQAYALQEYIKKIGAEVEIIDYRPSFLIKSYSITFNRKLFVKKSLREKIRHLIDYLLIFHMKVIRRGKFELFIKNYLHLSHRVDNELNLVYDAYVIGSDQVWNTNLARGFDKNYFGFFKRKSDAKVISYAASMKNILFTDEQVIKYRDAFRQFDAISIRENSNIKLLQSLTEKKIECVLDPTLLVDQTVWENIIKLPNTNTKYVLVYQVRVNAETVEIAQNIASQIGAKVIQITAWIDSYKDRNKLQYSSPEEFLGLFKKASCVVTTSFHGTAFAIVFHRPFYTIRLEDGDDNRSEELLNKLDISNRLISLCSRPLLESVDYSVVNKKLSTLRNESEQFIHTNLSIRSR